MSEPEVIIEQNMPSRAPDLVVETEPGGAWLVRQISDKLSAWVGLGSLEVSGRRLYDLFDDVSPDLGYLADEAASQDARLVRIAVQFQGPGERRLLADVLPGLGRDGWVLPCCQHHQMLGDSAR